MEMDGERIIKKAKKIPRWAIGGYIFCIIIIVSSIFWINYKEETETPDPIDFTTDGAIGMDTEQYAYLNVQGLTDEVAIYGDIENESSSTNDRYYIAFSKGYMYIVDLNFDTIELLKPWQDYLYSEDEDVEEPEETIIYGVTESIPSELKQMVLEFYNEGISEEYQIKERDFENYFGSVLLNVRKNPVDTSFQGMLIAISAIVLFVIFVIHVLLEIDKIKVKKYLKKNEYEEEIVRQLNDSVEEKHYNDTIILTKDFFIDLKYGGLVTFKYSDIKWIYIYNLKTYGVTTGTNLVVYLKDGKTKLTCLKINGNMTEEFLGILKKIYEKTSIDCLKGYTLENIKAFKEYKKELKN